MADAQLLDRRIEVAQSGIEGRRRGVLAGAWIALLLAILAFLVVYPVLTLLLGALTDTNPVVDGLSLGHLSIGNFLTVLSNPNVAEALFNTLIACGGGTAIAVVIGLLFSWIVVRTNTPFRGFIAAASILPLFAPPLVAGVAWSILGSPKTGLINTIFKWVGLDWRVDFYSMWGLIFVFGIYYAPYVYMFTSSALRNMDPSLEEAAEISGAERVLDAVHGDVPADHAGDRLRHAALLHRDARHLWRAGGAGRARQYQRADDLYLQAHQLVAAALQHRGRGRDHPDGGHGRAGLSAAEGALRAQLHHGGRQGVPAAQPRSRALALAHLLARLSSTSSSSWCCRCWR